MNLTDSPVLYHAIAADEKLAYRHTRGTGPGIFFCSGFNSTMEGNKARYLETLCRQRGWQYTRFDYRGHGESSGKFAASDFSQWREDALTMLDHVCDGPQIVVGSSMGGWIATLLALARPEKVSGLLTIAAAPDFTEELIWQQLDPDTQTRLVNGEAWCMPNHYDNGEPYRVGMALIESGRPHLLLHKPVAVTCAVRMLHGTGDTEVPCEFSCRLMAKLQSPDVRLILVKDADHRFSAPENLALVETTLVELHAMLS